MKGGDDDVSKDPIVEGAAYLEAKCSTCGCVRTLHESPKTDDDHGGACCLCGPGRCAKFAEPQPFVWDSGLKGADVDVTVIVPNECLSEIAPPKPLEQELIEARREAAATIKGLEDKFPAMTVLGTERLAELGAQLTKGLAAPIPAKLLIEEGRRVMAGPNPPIRIPAIRTRAWEDVKADMRPEVRQAAEGRVAWALQRCARPTCGHQRIDHSHGIIAPKGMQPRDIPADLPLVYSSTPTKDGEGACRITCGCREFLEQDPLVVGTPTISAADFPPGAIPPGAVVKEVYVDGKRAEWKDEPDDRWFVESAGGLAAEGAFHLLTDALEKAGRILPHGKPVFIENKRLGVRLTLDPKGARPDDWDNPRRVATPHFGPGGTEEYKHRGGFYTRAPMIFWGWGEGYEEICGPGSFFGNLSPEKLAELKAAPEHGEVKLVLPKADPREFTAAMLREDATIRRFQEESRARAEADAVESERRYRDDPTFHAAVKLVMASVMGAIEDHLDGSGLAWASKIEPRCLEAVVKVMPAVERMLRPPIQNKPLAALAREGAGYVMRPIRHLDRTKALTELADRGLFNDRREAETVPEGLTVQYVGGSHLIAQAFLKQGARKCRLSLFKDGHTELEVIEDPAVW